MLNGSIQNINKYTATIRYDVRDNSVACTLVPLRSMYTSYRCVRRFRRYVDIWMAFSLAMAAVATAVVPWCRSLTLLAAMLFVDGMGKGILAAGKVHKSS